MGACDIAGGKRDGNIVAARVCVHVHHFSGKVEARHAFGLHGARIDFFDADPAACNKRFLQGESPCDRQRGRL